MVWPTATNDQHGYCPSADERRAVATVNLYDGHASRWSATRSSDWTAVVVVISRRDLADRKSRETRRASQRLPCTVSRDRIAHVTEITTRAWSDNAPIFSARYRTPTDNTNIRIRYIPHGTVICPFEFSYL